MKSNSSPYRAGRPTPYSFCDRRCIRCFLFPNNIRKKDEKDNTQ